MPVAGASGGPQGEAEAAPTPAAPLLAAVVQSWEAEHEVVGVAWLDGPLLALLLEHRPRTLLHLYNQQGASGPSPPDELLQLLDGGAKGFGDWLLVPKL